MRFFRTLLAAFLVSQTVFAGLPPTTTKGSGDSTPVTTFQLNFPNIPVTHSGVVGTVGTIPIAGGGTGQVTANAALNALIPAQGSSSGQFLSTNGTNTSWAVPTAVVILAPPHRLTFTSSSGTYNLPYAFVISSGSATAGATYTNNGVTFTVATTVSSATLVTMSGSGAPASSGTLTKASGTGDATLTFSQVKTPLYLRVRLTGGGGGGSSSGSASFNNGIAGTSTTFGSSLLTATGGAGGGVGSSTAAGGTATVSSPAVGIGWDGANGQGAQYNNLADGTHGGMGGSSIFAGAGAGGAYGATGSAAKTNTGSGGGGGGGAAASAGVYAGGGGGAGAGIDALLYSPSATYAYSIGTGGSGGGAGTNGFNGGGGAAGVVIVEAYFQ